jgi:hypothetical protein
MLLLIAGGASAQIQEVQEAYAGGGGVTLTVSFPQAVKDGNTVIAAVQSTPGSAIVFATDELGDALVLDGEQVGAPPFSLDARLGIFRLSNSKGGPRNFTYQGSGVTGLIVTQLEYSGIAPVAPLDSAACMWTLPGYFNGLLVTHAPGEMLLNAVVSDGTVLTADPRWSLRDSASQMLVEDLLPSPGNHLVWATGDGTYGEACTVGYFPALAQKPVQLAPLQSVTTTAEAMVSTLNFAAATTSGDTVVVGAKWVPPGSMLTVVDGTGLRAEEVSRFDNATSASAVFVLHVDGGSSAITYSIDADGGWLLNGEQFEYPSIAEVGTPTADGGPGGPVATSALSIAGPTLLFNFSHADGCIFEADPSFETRSSFGCDLVQDRFVVDPGNYGVTANSDAGLWVALLVPLSFSFDGGPPGEADAGLDAGAGDQRSGLLMFTTRTCGCAAGVSGLPGFALIVLALRAARRLGPTAPRHASTRSPCSSNGGRRGTSHTHTCGRARSPGRAHRRD